MLLDQQQLLAYIYISKNAQQQQLGKLSTTS